METANTDKFVCKFCNKRFTCGKSLGGHIRIHLNGSSKRSNLDDEEEEFNISKSSVDAQFGLRENPKRSTRFVFDSNIYTDLECRECGKEFESLKALCGHMACHARNGGLDDQLETDGKLREQVMDGYSDTETSGLIKRRRSKRIRYKNGSNNCSSLMSVANFGCSFSGSDIEKEQEEVAMSLIMLSRDSGFDLSSVANLSTNNSVTFDGKSSTKMGTSSKNDAYSLSTDLQKLKKMASVVSSNDDQFVDPDSGCFRISSKNVEYGNSGYIASSRNDEFKKQKLDLSYRFDQEFGSESGKRLSRFRRIETNSANERNRIDREDIGSIKIDSDDHGNVGQSGRNCFAPMGLKARDENQISSTGQVKHYSSKYSMEQKYSSGIAEKKSVSRKGKLHKCPFCSKAFKSGQALGGHKRSHFIGGSTEDTTVMIQQQGPEVSIPALIDLNLPASVEEDV